MFYHLFSNFRTKTVFFFLIRNVDVFVKILDFLKTGTLFLDFKKNGLNFVYRQIINRSPRLKNIQSIKNSFEPKKEEKLVHKTGTNLTEKPMHQLTELKNIDWKCGQQMSLVGCFENKRTDKLKAATENFLVEMFTNWILWFV